ncbi:MAG: hypothetical protein F6J86_39520 [Symploca sp. SIO1B1]|nr:hypothetical protein [Symploca sp. SIO1B1]
MQIGEMLMLGSREWIKVVQKNLSTGNPNDPNSQEFYKKLLIQGKKISQLISYIWLGGDGAKQLDVYFKEIDKNKKIKDLFCACKDETKKEQTPEYELLKKVFPKDSDLPIFSINDAAFFEFKIATNKFEGSFSDPAPQENKVLYIAVPYPPRPAISEFSPEERENNPFSVIDKQELEEWLESPSDESPYFPPSNPYIPASSS